MIVACAALLATALDRHPGARRGGAADRQRRLRRRHRRWYSYGTTARRHRRPALHRRPGRAGQPVGRRHRPERRLPLIAGAEYTLVLRRLSRRRRRPCASPSSSARRRTPPTFTQAVPLDRRRAPTGSASPSPATPERPGRLPGRRQRRRRTRSAWTTSRCAAARRQPPYVPDTGPRVRVNQVGYLPDGPKNATVVTEATEPLPWQLRNAAGAVVASGTTTPRGVDAASGQNVQTVDFSGVPHRGHRLHADRRRRDQPPVRHLRRPSTTSCAPTRCSSSTSSAAASRSTATLVGAQYARPAGHLGVAPNQGDTDVPCQPGVCDYRLDVRGGWYDAGDHGKYVVNGGIATYQLLNTFERTKTAPTADAARRSATARCACPSAATACPTSSTRPAGSSSSCCACRCRPASRSPAWPTTRCTTSNWTGLPLAAAGRPAAARAAPAVDRGHAQPGRRRRPVRPAVRPVRRGVRRPAACAAAQTAYAAAKANPARVRRPERRHRRRRLRRQRRHRRVLLGRRRAVPHHRRGGLPGRPDRLAAPHRRRLHRHRASTGAAPPRSAGSTWPPCRTDCPPPTGTGSAQSVVDRRRRATSPRCAARRTGCRCPATRAATSGAPTATSSTTRSCWPPRST